MSSPDGESLTENFEDRVQAPNLSETRNRTSFVYGRVPIFKKAMEPELELELELQQEPVSLSTVRYSLCSLDRFCGL